MYSTLRLVETMDQFHQCSKSSFYTRIPQMRKKDLQFYCLFYTFGICMRKSCSQNVAEIDTRYNIWSLHYKIAIVPKIANNEKYSGRRSTKIYITGQSGHPKMYHIYFKDLLSSFLLMSNRVVFWYFVLQHNISF